jgi:phytol kinase
MLEILIALVGVAALVFAGEKLRVGPKYHAEVTRKFVHITVAMFVATWSFWMSWSHIELMSLLMFVGVLVSRYFHFFKAIHDIKRHTWGELFYAMSIGMVAVLSQDKWIFAAAMLLMGLADGLAALVGTMFGGKHRYKILGHYKSREGTFTFWAVAVVIVLVCGVLNGPHEGWTLVLWLPVVATFFENFAVAGTDNLLVPLIVTLLL